MGKRYWKLPLSIKLRTKQCTSAGGVSALIPFKNETDNNGARVYGTPWTSQIYELYSTSVSNGHVVLIDFYSDGATMSRSGTLSATFHRVRFSNLYIYCGNWFTVGIAPTAKTLSSSLPAAQRRKLKLLLMQRFLFTANY